MGLRDAGAMADVVVTIALRFLHIAFAVMWIGAVAYGVLVLGVAMARVEMGARKETMRHLIPVATHYVPLSAVMTIVFGAILYLYVGEFDVDYLTGSLWGRLIFAAMVLAIVTFVFGMTFVIGAAKKVRAHLEEEKCTHGPEVGKLQARFNNGQIVVLALGLAILGLMVSARSI
jgi:uncharacterized membrane protein